MKFDNIRTEGAEEHRSAMRKALGLAPTDRVLLAGSTHPNEEATLYGIYEELRKEAPEFRFVVVPRHPERFPEVESLLARRGANVVRKTTLDPSRGEKDRPVILVDTMGELADLYGVADLVFVGGSLIPHGGQNMMEPAGLGRAVFFGPHFENFQESVDILLDADAAVMARDAEELRRELLTMAREPGRASAMGDRARKVVQDHKGASVRILELIRPFFSDPAGKGHSK
jgi:3-deoxy-D-manno-octulosonic-acid transferase